MYIKFFAWGSTFASSLCRGALLIRILCTRITFARKTHKRCRFQQQWMGWRTVMCRAGQERAMSLANLSVMMNKGRIIFGVHQVQSDEVFAIVPSASLASRGYLSQSADPWSWNMRLHCRRRVQWRWTRIGDEILCQHRGERRRTPPDVNIWTSGHQGKDSSSSTPSQKIHQKVVEMVNAKVPSHGKYEQDGAGINNSSLGMTMPLYAKGTVGEDDAINAGRLNKNQQKGPNYESLSIECSVHNKSLIQ